MTERFEISLLPIDHYVKTAGQEYTCAVIRFDIIHDGVRFDNGYDSRYECSLDGLQSIIAAAEEFLAGNITETRELRFVVPYLYGGHDSYRYSFDVIADPSHADDHWVFHASYGYPAAAYSCELSPVQICAVRDSLSAQISDFDWENYGKTEYYTLSAPEKEYRWCYSAKGLEQQLRRMLAGELLESVYVEGMNYAEPLSEKTNAVNYYLGSRVYLRFARHHADIQAHASGLFQMRVFLPEEVVFHKHYGFLDFLVDSNALCEPKYVFSLNYAGEIVRDVRVISVPYWEWTAKGFDESRVGDPVELPECVSLSLGNGTTLSVIGCNDDFILRMDELGSDSVQRRLYW